MKSRNSVRPATEVPIGALAEAAGVNVETIRYYQRRGLVEEPNKPMGGHRRYSASAVKRVVFIKRAQQLGFTLEEVKALLRLEDGQSCGENAPAAQDLNRRMFGREAPSLLPHYRHAFSRCLTA